jgi:hypothetical protein
VGKAVPDRQVLGDGQRQEGRGLLVDEPKPSLPRPHWRHRACVDAPAGDQEIAAVSALDAGKDLHQGRLAGAVAAEKRVDRAAPNVERHSG